MSKYIGFSITDAEFVCSKSWYIPNFVYRAVLKRLLDVNVEATNIKLKEAV